VSDISDFVPAPNRNPLGPATEFNDWMKFLDAQERETMTLRFIEEWETTRSLPLRPFPSAPFSGEYSTLRKNWRCT
jgi:hypothetical protein